MTQTPALHASDAAEAVRSLNHATLRRGEDWQYPGDAYSVVGNLVALAERLPQALNQARDLLQHLRTGGHIRSDKGGDGLPEVIASMAGLRSAAEYADAMRAALGDVHSALSPLAYQD